MAAATYSTNIANRDKHLHVLVGGKPFDANSSSGLSESLEFQHAMQVARDKFGHALCLCRRTPLKLQIRLRDNFHLAVWPEEGALHDSNCVFFRTEDSFKPASEFAGGVQSLDDERREIALNFGFERGQTDRFSSVPGEAKQSTPITLRGLTHILWDEANLTRWHPRWSRDWGRTRYELLQAASRIKVRGDRPLSDYMFVPRPYRESDKEILNQELDRFVQRLATTDPSNGRGGLIIAPVRRIKRTASSSVIHLRHLRLPVGLTDAAVDFLSQQCRAAYRRLWLNEDPIKEEKGPGWKEAKHPEVVAVLHVDVNPRGGMWCRGAWLLLVHPSVFIPANSADEVKLIDALIRDGHQFNRILSVEQASQRSSPDWVVRHVIDPEGKPVQKAMLEIISNGADAAFLEKRAALADKFADKGVPLWTWVPVGRQIDHIVPPLPPSQDMTQQDAQRVIDKLHFTGNVTYAYGSQRVSRK